MRPDGCLTLTDRVKDVIQSGGEWISCVELRLNSIAVPSTPSAVIP